MTRQHHLIDACGADLLPDDEELLLPVRRVPSQGRRRQRGVTKPSAMSEILRSDVATFARAARATTGLDQEEFAARLGIATTSLIAIEKAKADTVSLALLSKMARAGGRRLTLGLGE